MPSDKAVLNGPATRPPTMEMRTSDMMMTNLKSAIPNRLAVEDSQQYKEPVSVWTICKNMSDDVKLLLELVYRDSRTNIINLRCRSLEQRGYLKSCAPDKYVLSPDYARARAQLSEIGTWPKDAHAYSEDPAHLSK